MTNKPAITSSKDLTKTEEFNPTPTMEKWLDTAIELQSDSPTDIANESKITKQSWYHWLKNVDGFEDWYYANYKRRRRRWLPTLDKIGMKNAEKDFNYWKEMRKASGEVEEKGPSTAIQINFDSKKYIKNR